jgi:hypothetical protein
MLGPAQRLKLLSHSADHQSQGRLVSAALQVWAKSLVKVASPPAAAASQALCYSSCSHYASSSSAYQLSRCLAADLSSQISFQSFDQQEDSPFFHCNVQDLHAHELFQSWEHYVQSFTKQ